MWQPNAPYGVIEVSKTRWRSVPYTSGKGLDLGCGQQRLFDTEFVVSIDNGSGSGGANVVANLQLDAKELTLFTGSSWDYVFSSYLLQEFPYADVPAVLRDWLRVIKPGGYLVLYLPDETICPKVDEAERAIKGEPGALPGQKWNVNYDRVVAAMQRTAWNWDLEHYEVCHADDEHSLFFAFRRLK